MLQFVSAQTDTSWRSRWWQCKSSSGCLYTAQCQTHIGTDRHFTKEPNSMHGIGSQGCLHCLQPTMTTAVCRTQTDNTWTRRRRRNTHTNINKANYMTHSQHDHRHMQAQTDTMQRRCWLAHESDASLTASMHHCLHHLLPAQSQRHIIMDR